MGIKRLTKVIDDEAPSAVKENEIKNYFGQYISTAYYVIIITTGQRNLTQPKAASPLHTDGSSYSYSPGAANLHRIYRKPKNGCYGNVP